MSRIAIIDTAIDSSYIGGRAVEHINLCGESGGADSGEIGHGTLCAMVLEHCARDYELVNIQIFAESRGKVFGEIGALAKALALCVELKIDVVSLSAVSSILSDSKHIYDITEQLSRSAVVVSALDNKRFMSVPTGYPCVLGVRSDGAGALMPGELAYSEDDPFGANIYANCNFALLRERGCPPSNSFAVPVAAAYVNGLLNQGMTISDIGSAVRALRPYPAQAEHAALCDPAATRGIPIIFLADGNLCRALMDGLYEKYDVQSTALSLIDGEFDVRIKKVNRMDAILDDMRFMKRHYKTDLIFVIGKQDIDEKIRRDLDVDIELTRYDDGRTAISYESERELEFNSSLPDRLHEILTT
jgi:hypothetical protein